MVQVATLPPRLVGKVTPDLVIGLLRFMGLDVRDEEDVPVVVVVIVVSLSNMAAPLCPTILLIFLF